VKQGFPAQNPTLHTACRLNGLSHAARSWRPTSTPRSPRLTSWRTTRGRPSRCWPRLWRCCWPRSRRSSRAARRAPDEVGACHSPFDCCRPPIVQTASPGNVWLRHARPRAAACGAGALPVTAVRLPARPDAVAVYAEMQQQLANVRNQVKRRGRSYRPTRGKRTVAQRTCRGNTVKHMSACARHDWGSCNLPAAGRPPPVGSAHSRACGG
jgi:hypothetical protein